MKVLFSSACKPIPVFLNRFLSIDDVSYRFIVDQGPFSASADVPCFSLHFLAQNIATPSVVLEWPTLEELEKELKSDHYDYIAISFKIIDMDHIGQMIPFIRRVSPHTKIILGGYGTLGLSHRQFAYIRDGADYICDQGDGVKFLRKLLGEPTNRGVKAHLPVEIIRIPWLSKMTGSFSFETQVGYLLSALGCVWKCEFCCTSAYTHGQTVDVMTAREIFDSMKWYYRNNHALKHIFVMDEEILLRKHKVEAIGKLIREDDEFGLSTMTYLAFGTMKALSRWDPEQMLLNGVGEIWTGIESKFSYQKKKGEADQKSIVDGLAAVGIEPQLSWIMGDDCQNKDNIQEDIDELIRFNPVTVQLTTLAAFPGTGLFSRLEAEGRVRVVKPEEYHLFGNTMESLHFTHEERVSTILGVYDRLYKRLGPSMMRTLGVQMNGYEFCMRSKNPFLNVHKKAFFKKRIEFTIFLIKTAIEMAPSAEARSAMENLYQRYVDLFGPMRKSQQAMADRALAAAQKEMERRAREGYSSIREIPLKRYVYEGTDMPLVESVPMPAMVVPPTSAGSLPVMQ